MSLHGRKRHAERHGTLDPPGGTQHTAYTDINWSRPSPSRTRLVLAREDRRGSGLGAHHTGRTIYAELRVHVDVQGVAGVT